MATSDDQTLSAILEEVQQVLDQVDLANGDPLYRQGAYATVMLVPEPSLTSTGDWSVVLTVRPHHLLTDALERERLYLRGEDGDSSRVTRIGRLNRHGQVMFRVVPPGRYRLWFPRVASWRRQQDAGIVEQVAAAEAATEGALQMAYRDIVTADGQLRVHLEVADDEWGARLVRLTLATGARAADGRFVQIEWQPERGDPVICLARLRWDDTVQASHATLRLIGSDAGLPLSVEGELVPPDGLLDEDDLLDVDVALLHDARRRDESPEGRRAWAEVIAQIAPHGAADRSDIE
jgi:hypothetical protein